MNVSPNSMQGAAERRSKNAEQRAQIIEMRRAQHNAAPGKVPNREATYKTKQLNRNAKEAVGTPHNGGHPRIEPGVMVQPSNKQRMQPRGISTGDYPQASMRMEPPQPVVVRGTMQPPKGTRMMDPAESIRAYQLKMTRHKDTVPTN